MKGNVQVKRTHRKVSFSSVAAVSIVTGALMAAGALNGFSPVSPAQAEEHSGGSGGHTGGSGGHDSGTMHSDSDHGSKGPGYHGGSSARGGAHPGAASQELEEKVFRGKGHDFSTSEEDSDRPEWAGGGGKPGTGKPDSASTKKGDLFGDLYVIKRDPLTGAPILDSEGRVQFLDEYGNVIPYNEEGEVSEPEKLLEVDFSRLNIGRAPTKVLQHALAEAEKTIATDADGVLQTDAAGRIVVVDKDGTVSTIDSPLENLALYVNALQNLASGTWTLSQAAVFLGAASDKTVPVTLDEMVYLNDILKINTAATGYFDFTKFTYDRSSTYDGKTVTYLVDNGDGTYKTETKSVLDAVFGGTDYDASGATAFAQAADDARAVINFIHEPIH